MSCVGQRQPLENERPDIVFSCRRLRSSEIIFENNSRDVVDVGWKEYLDVDKSSKKPGLTYPHDLDALNRLGDEADRMMNGTFDDDGDDLASLLGSSPEPGLDAVA